MNIREQHIDALSLLVFNTESLYIVRHEEFKLNSALADMYVFYTKEQFDILQEDLKSDLEEIKENK